MIFFWTQHTQQAQGSGTKKIACEGCGDSYTYSITRTGRGSADAPFCLGQQRADQAASKRALSDLQKELEAAVEMVPCPECGLYQQNMVQAARRRKYRWIANASWWAIFLSLAPIMLGVLIAIAKAGHRIPDRIKLGYCVLVVVIVGAGVILRIGHIYLSRRYDPNSIDVEDRKRIGRSLAQRRM